MSELRCSGCDSTDFYGPAVFDERLITAPNLYGDIPHKVYRLAYKTKRMCKNCGRTIEAPNEVPLDLHKLAQFVEIEK